MKKWWLFLALALGLGQARGEPVRLLSAEVVSVTNCQLEGAVLTFSGALSPLSAQALENYSIPGVAVHEAITLAAAPEIVLLLTSPWQCGQSYELTVRDLRDATNGLIELDPSTLTLTTTQLFCCNQQYSLDLPAGYSLLANQLNRGSNTLAEVLPQVPDGTVVQLLDETPSTFTFSDGAWDGSAILAPGEGFFILLPVPAQLTFSGAWPGLRPPLQWGSGPVVVSLPFPRRATFEQLTGRLPEPGVIVHRLLRGSSSTALDSGSYQTYIFQDGSWFGGEPRLEVGEAVLVELQDPPHVDQMTLTQFRVRLGSPLSVSFSAMGALPLHYQWRRNAMILPGETNALLHFEALGLAEGGSYDLLVGNSVSVAVSQRVVVALDLPTLPLSDLFADAVTVSDPSGLGRADNSLAKFESGEPNHAGQRASKSLWLNWTSPTAGLVTFRSLGSGFDTLLGAYLGDKVDDLERIASDDDAGPALTSAISFQAQPGLVYHVVVDGYGSGGGELVMSWDFEPTAESLPVIVTQPRSLAARPGDPVEFAVEATGASLSYQWFADGQPLPGQTAATLELPAAGLADIATYFVRVFEGPRFVDSRRVVLEFSLLGPFNELGDRLSVVKFSDLKPPLEEGGGVGDDLSGARRAGRGSMDRPGDDLSGARRAGRGSMGPTPVQPASLARGYTGTQIFSTVGAVSQPDEPQHCGVAGSGSHWFAYMAPASGTFTVNTDGSNFDTVLAVYLGGDLNNLTPVACDRNGGTNGLTSKVSFPAERDLLYYIAVDGENGQQGTVFLNYALLIPVQLSGLMFDGNMTRFTVTSTPAYPLTIERSSNYVDWAALLTTNPPTGTVVYQEMVPMTSGLYYRVMQRP